MPRRHIRVTDAAEGPLRAALHDLRGRLEVPDHFPYTAQAEAESAARAPRIPAGDGEVHTEHALDDATDLPLFTLAPAGAADLDRAMFLARRPGGGYRVYYATADIASFVTPGGALDADAHHRVTTLCFPDERVPLYPPVLGEGAAALLPDRDRPAVLWQLDLDADGALTSTAVRRALVRSRARLDHPGVQRVLDDGTAEEPLVLLQEIGLRREELETARGAVSLTAPEQVIAERGGRYTLTYRAPLPAAAWHAQISLLTGMAAARLMLAAGTGILRTLPPPPGRGAGDGGPTGAGAEAGAEAARGDEPEAGHAASADPEHRTPADQSPAPTDPHRPTDPQARTGPQAAPTEPHPPPGSVARLRRTAEALGVDWPHHTSYAALIRGLDPRRPGHAAFLQECTTLLSDAGYTVFDGTAPPASAAVHAAVAAPYAHATAPLRRLVDRYTSELCLAAAAGRTPPGWVRAALPALPDDMAAGARRAHEVERACLDLVAAALLRDRVGETFEALVIDHDPDDPTRPTVHLTEPPVTATLTPDPDAPPLPLGHHITIRLTSADPAEGRVRFTVA
ncbi:ribonuclease II [Streptomyces sp. NRRL F-4489]|uniref:RNB domain-containing ribonuclease n=1 Tax=Streptomyces sp. NRRL F-4489 TaxID=1609095 RepID=UPI000747CB77|nr:RNB domain-containing ribonuclease [Streptomyces sp. NRRL F-4489]KUL54888.1 ribonuclease II [Streptomyces sp. NRRL F-4489]